MPNKQRKTALVTGGAHRVGRAISLQLARQGYDVIVHHWRSRQAAQRTARDILGFGVRAKTIKADLARASEAKLLGHKAWRSGPVDVLVNSAAIFFKTPFGRTREADWNRVIDTNLKSVFFLSQELGTRMQRRGRGQIINILDVGAYRAWTGYLPYCSSKAGAAMLTQGLAKALAPKEQPSV